MGAARIVGKVALYATANVVINPLRMATGEPPMLIRPRTPAQRADSAARGRARRRAMNRQHAIERHLAGKRLEPVVYHQLREYQAATGSLPQWFIDGTGSTTLH
jgi:hypothetical protein